MSVLLSFCGTSRILGFVFVFRGMDEDSKIIWDKVVTFCNEFQLHKLSSLVMLSKLAKNKNWSKPPSGSININIDAAWDNGKMSI